MSAAENSGLFGAFSDAMVTAGVEGYPILTMHFIPEEGRFNVFVMVRGEAVAHYVPDLMNLGQGMYLLERQLGMPIARTGDRQSPFLRYLSSEELP